MGSFMDEVDSGLTAMGRAAGPHGHSLFGKNSPRTGAGVSGRAFLKCKLSGVLYSLVDRAVADLRNDSIVAGTRL